MRTMDTSARNANVLQCVQIARSFGKHPLHTSWAYIVFFLSSFFFSQPNKINIGLIHAYNTYRMMPNAYVIDTIVIRKTLFFSPLPLPLSLTFGSVNHHTQQYRRHANLQLCFVRWESIDMGPIHWTEHSKWFRLSIFECDLVFIVSHTQNGIHESHLYVFLAPAAGHVDRLIVHVRGPTATFAQSLQENPQILKCYFFLLHKWMGKQLLNQICIWIN